MPLRIVVDRARQIAFYLTSTVTGSHAVHSLALLHSIPFHSYTTHPS